MSLQPKRLLSTITVAVLIAATLPCFAQKDPAPFPAGDDSDPTGRLPQVISRVEPVLGAELAATHFDEDVYVAFVVDSAGQPIRVRAFFSQHEELEAPAVAAVRQWKFTPGFHGGRNVSTRMVVALHFGPPPTPPKST